MSEATPVPPAGHPVPFDWRPAHVYALGLTYADHAREAGEAAGAPVVFHKRCGPDAARDHMLTPPAASVLAEAVRALDPALAGQLGQELNRLPVLLDYEIELGIVVLEPVTRTQLDDPHFAPRLAYVLINDVTARSVQIAGEGAADRLAFWSAAKSFAGFLPVAASAWRPDVPDLEHWPDVRLQTRVNGGLRQDASTRELRFTPRQLLRIAAGYAPGQRLNAHDLVLTGTPAGVAWQVPAWQQRLAAWLPRAWRLRLAWRLNRNKSGFLKPGDEVVCQADWLGELRIRIR